MTLIRSDQQVALNDLLVAIQKIIDHCRDAEKLLPESAITHELHAQASQHELVIPKLENVIRTLGDLPSVPDPDRESGEMLIHHLGAELSADYEKETLEQRIHAEQEVTRLVNAAREAGADESCAALLDTIADNAAQATGRLQALLQQIDH